MRGFFDPRQLEHAPQSEFFNGALSAHADVPFRAESVSAALGALELPKDHGEAPILRVHAPDYIQFLKDAPRLWAEAGRPGEPIGYVWPVKGRRPVALTRVDALLGRYSYDATTPVTAGAFTAAYWSSQCALSALDTVLAGERAAFALCRPPGHHAGADYLGGYCYLNHAAVTAQAARDAGVGRVAILDVDYHHGNGTQDIFAARSDVFFASVHADPAGDYPYYWGHADEAGEGEGAGATLNLPLAAGAGLAEFHAAQAKALDAIAAFDPGLIVVSFGADTFIDDPISRFRLETADYAVLAADIAALGLPTVIVMEGGYADEALGRNVASFLSGFA